jgi:hypothetical protein
MSGGAQRTQAIRRLVLCNALWGVSFPTLKALILTQQSLLPDASAVSGTAVDGLHGEIIYQALNVYFDPIGLGLLISPGAGRNG